MLSRNLWRVLKVYVFLSVLAYLYAVLSNYGWVELGIAVVVLVVLGLAWFLFLNSRVKPFLRRAGVWLDNSFLGGHEKLVLVISVLPLVWVVLLFYWDSFVYWFSGIIYAVVGLTILYLFVRFFLGKVGVKQAFNDFEVGFFSFFSNRGFDFARFLNFKSDANKLYLGRVSKVLKSRVTQGRLRSIKEWFWKDEAGVFVLDPKRELNRHGLIVGSSGTGKSNFLKTLTEELCEHECVHVFDSHGEYAKSFKGLVLKLGEQGLNPWSLDGKSAGYRIHENVEVLADVLDLGAQQTYFLTIAARNAFKRKGFDLELNEAEDLDPPGFDEVLAEARKLERESSSVKTLCRRLEGLMWSHLFPSEDSFDIGDLMKMKVCFDAKGIPTPGQKKLFTEIYMRKLYHTAVSTPREKHLTVIIDEAEGLIINPEAYPTKGYESYADRLSAEARKFKIGLILGTQRCTALSKGLVQNAGLFVAFYVQEPIDAKYVAKLLCGNSSDEWKLSVVQEMLNNLGKGECVIMTSGVYRDPVVVKTDLFKESDKTVVQKFEPPVKKKGLQKTLTEENELIKPPEVKTEDLLKKEVEKGLNDKERKVLEHLRVHGSVSASSYAVLIGVDRRTVDRYLEDLLSKGLIVKKQEGRSVVFVLKK